MSVEDNIKDYLRKIEELKELEALIEQELPEGLWRRYNNLKMEIPSDKSVLQKQLKDGKTSVEVEGHRFSFSTRTKTAISKDFIHVAKDMGHLDDLVEMGVIKDFKVNEEQIQRLPVEMQAIYLDLINTFDISVLRWPKKADL